DVYKRQAWEFDPYFGLSVSRVDPLPHQLEAVYDYLLKLPQVRFLLADDAGAGKTIMSGLLIRELQLRGLAERILIVTPANLAFQWQRELNEKFGEVFKVLKGNDLRAQYGVNQWIEQKKIITSLDLAKRDEILPGLRQVNWDLVIVDEAHRMSARDETHKSQRYKLGELLRDSSDHYLLLTATPHRGDPVNFNLFLQLLDKDAYADVQSIKEAMRRRRAPFYLRRTKEAMVHFPKRNDDGVWEARKIFTNRIPRTVAFHIDGDEMDLYRAVSAFIKKQSREAGQNENNTRARAVGFLMALYQRRLASSAHAVQHSLENRANRLEKELSQNKATDDFSVPSTEDLEEMDDEEREKIERRIDGLTLSRNPAEVLSLIHI
ncbi:MAG: DEAD/DEAH box helicase, partial [Alphaproteobacteria bacterium]|nr:DEAD/DEAH box helicase [Alphaproteobacteria bacterium]